MEELIKIINYETGFRVKLFYYVDGLVEGYKAGFYADDSEMEEVFDNPIDAINKLVEDYKLNI